MKVIRLTLIFTLIAFLSFQGNAQFGALKNRVKDKLNKKIEDKVVEELSDAIAERAFRPIGSVLDKFIEESYPADTTSHGDIDWDKVNSSYSEMLAGMNKAANLPESYTFDVTFDIEIKDYEKKKHYSKMHFITGKAVMGIEQEENGETSIMVMDNDNDLMAIYTIDKQGNKRLQTLPNMMTLASTLAPAMKGDSPEDSVFDANFEIRKTGKTKKIAGYKSDQYKGENENEDLTFYLTKDSPVNWQDMFGSLMEKFAPKSYSEMDTKVEGMLMYSESVRKNNKRMKSTWEVKKIRKDAYAIDNSEWEMERSIGDN